MTRTVSCSEEEARVVPDQQCNSRREPDRPKSESGFVPSIHRAVGNQATQSVARDHEVSTNRIPRETETTTERRPSEPESKRASSSSLTTDTCPRCVRRYRAGKPLNCDECEQALRRSNDVPSVSGAGIKGGIRSRIEISNRDDRSEREAERVAKTVMRMSDPASLGTEQVAESADTQLACPDRQCLPREGEQSNCDERGPTLRRRERSDVSPVTKRGSGRQLRSLTGTGRSLPESMRTFFEPRFGQDFSDVRIHTDAKADDAARSVNARAFTLGQDIVFRAGEYQPATRDGKRLLAHELTHVVQQRTDPHSGIGGAVRVQRAGPVATGAAVAGGAALACAAGFFLYAMENMRGYGDDYLHCWTSCQIASYCPPIPALGQAVSYLIGAAKEAMDVTIAEGEVRDMINNHEGIQCSLDLFGPSCHQCCQTKQKQGQLAVGDPTEEQQRRNREGRGVSGTDITEAQAIAYYERRTSEQVS